MLRVKLLAAAAACGRGQASVRVRGAAQTGRPGPARASESQPHRLLVPHIAQLAAAAACTHAQSVNAEPACEVHQGAPRASLHCSANKERMGVSAAGQSNCLAATMTSTQEPRTDSDVCHAAIRWVHAALVQHVACPRVRVYMAGQHQVDLRPGSRRVAATSHAVVVPQPRARPHFTPRPCRCNHAEMQSHHFQGSWHHRRW